MPVHSDFTMAKYWDGLASDLRLPATLTAAAGQVLADGYNEPHRRYHTAVHIEAMLTKLAEVRAHFDDPEAAGLAILFHDLVYDPVRNDNEALSAEALHRLLDGHVDPARLDRACAHILATRRHEATGDSDTDRVLDLDMAVLGAPWPAYGAYAIGVRDEYLPVTAPRPMRRDGSRSFSSRL